MENEEETNSNNNDDDDDDVVVTVALGTTTSDMSGEVRAHSHYSGTHQNEESDAVSSIQAVARSKVDYGKAIERVSGLKSRVSQIREVLKKLEHESAWEEVLPVDRKREWDLCPESHLAIKKEDKRVG